MKAHMLRILILSIQLLVTVMQSLPPIISSVLMTDWIILLVLQIRKICLHTSWIPAGNSVMRMILQGLNSLIKTFITSIKKYEMKHHLDSSKENYSSRVGLNTHERTTSEYTVVFELHFHLCIYWPQVVLR